MQTRWMANLLLVPLFLISLAGHHSALGTDGDQAPEPESKASKLDQRAEGESLLSGMRNRARVSYAKFGEPAETLSGAGAKGCDVKEAERTGSHGAVHDKIYTTTDGSPALVFECKGDGGFGILVFEWDTGKSKTSWYDSMDQLKKAHLNAKPDKGAEPDDGKTGEAKDAPAADDVWALYKKKGRSWMHKATTHIGEMDPMVSYMKYEITEVAEDYAIQKLTLLDAAKEAMEFVPPSETKISFPRAVADEGVEAPTVEQKEESIEVAGKKWDAMLYETDTNGKKTKTWMSKKFPGLLLRMETTGDAGGMKMNTKMELVEWNE